LTTMASTLDVLSKMGGHSDLIDVIRGGSADLVDDALARWGDVNKNAKDGESPIVACCEVGRAKLLSRLLSAGASPDASSSSGLSALGAAAMSGNLECSRLLLQAGAKADQAGGRSRSTPLSYAAQEGYRSVCEALVAAGADPRKQDAFGMSPIDYAERREGETKIRAAEFTAWVTNNTERAAVINAEPQPKAPLFPHDLRGDLNRLYQSQAKDKGLWQPGEWLHQKQIPSTVVLDQRKQRPFSSTGYGVSEPTPPPDDCVFPAEDMAMLATAEKISMQTRRAISMERSAENPHNYTDDVDATLRQVRAAAVDNAGSLQLKAQQEEYIAAMYPDVATSSRDTPLYTGEMQKESVSCENAAASLVPVLAKPPDESLVEVLKRPPPDAEY